ncbi:MAG: hypothetical protein HY721_16910 [Planctomycetes bacterium]|nr:hypothetical protein [Planctomycetota bacterium]
MMLATRCARRALLLSLVPLAAPLAAFGSGPAFLVKDIDPGPEGSWPFQLVDVKGELYFHATDGRTGFELWRSDGTESGTRLVDDLNLGPADSTPGSLTAVGGDLFFLADDGVEGRELWVLGSGGVTRVEDTRPGPEGMLDGGLCAVGPRLFFMNRDWAGGRPNTFQLWTSDGSDQGTFAIADAYVNSYVMTAAGKYLYFAGMNGATYPAPDTTLWRSDGTPGGTAPVKPWVPEEVPVQPYDLTPMGGSIYFGGSTVGRGVELWRFNESDGAIALVKDINPGQSPDGAGDSSGPLGLTAIGGVLYFWANDGVRGTELWRSDGRLDTRLLKDLNLRGDSNPTRFTPLGGKVLFVADDGSSGRELWVTDGTEEGTRMLKDIRPFGGSDPWLLTVVPGGRVAIFSADDGAEHGRELWITDGTEEGTRLLQDIVPGPAPSNPIANGWANKPFPISGGHVFFTAQTDAAGQELWAVPVACIRDGYSGDCRSAAGQAPSDLNQDAALDISDGVALLLFLFGGRSSLPCSDGTIADPGNLALLDSNGDADVDLSDAIRVFGFLFLGAPPPVLGTECLEIPGCPDACGPGS